jgi:hypothetical protein
VARGNAQHPRQTIKIFHVRRPKENNALVTKQKYCLYGRPGHQIYRPTRPAFPDLLADYSNCPKCRYLSGAPCIAVLAPWIAGYWRRRRMCGNVVSRCQL